MGPFQPAASARVAMHCGARADSEWEWARGAGGGGRRIWARGAVSGLSFYSLLPILEFSAGQSADGRFVLVPGVGEGEVSVKRPKPRREEGWPDGGAGLNGTIPGTR